MSSDQATTALRAAAALDSDAVRQWYTNLVTSRRTAAQKATQPQPQAQQQRQRPSERQAKPSSRQGRDVRQTPWVLESLSEEGGAPERVLGKGGPEGAAEIVMDLLQGNDDDDHEERRQGDRSRHKASKQRHGMQGHRAEQPRTPSAASASSQPAAARPEGPETPRGTASAQHQQPPMPAPQLESVDFDEEAAGAASAFRALHDRDEGHMPATPPPPAAGSSELLLDRLGDLGQGVMGDEEVNSAELKSEEENVKGPAASQAKAHQGSKQAVTPAQLRALRSVLLERLEAVEAMQQEVESKVAAAEARTEKAAIVVSCTDCVRCRWFAGVSFCIFVVAQTFVFRSSFML